MSFSSKKSRSLEGDLWRNFHLKSRRKVFVNSSQTSSRRGIKNAVSLRAHQQGPSPKPDEEKRCVVDSLWNERFQRDERPKNEHGNISAKSPLFEMQIKKMALNWSRSQPPDQCWRVLRIFWHLCNEGFLPKHHIWRWGARGFLCRAPNGLKEFGWRTDCRLVRCLNSMAFVKGHGKYIVHRNFYQFGPTRQGLFEAGRQKRQSL